MAVFVLVGLIPAPGTRAVATCGDLWTVPGLPAGVWLDLKAPRIPLEEWKVPLFDLISERTAQLGVIVPTEPVAALYTRAWRRVRDGDIPRLEELRVRRGRRR